MIAPPYFFLAPDNRNPRLRFPATMAAAGGMGAGAKDLARWIRVNLNGGAIDDACILSEKWMAEMHKLQDEGKGRIPSFVPRTREGHGFAWFVGTYRDELFIEHGGGYKRTEAFVSFMPETNMGVAVVANADGVAAQFVVMDIYDRLPGAEGEDLLPRIKGVVDRRLASNARRVKIRRPNPVKDGGLSLTPNAYAATYFHEDWGTIEVRFEKGRLVGKQGALTLDFATAGKDEFLIYYGVGDPDGGRFEVEDGRNVTAIIMQLYGKPYRFVRK